jgi:hypothetical protein
MNPMIFRRKANPIATTIYMAEISSALIIAAEASSIFALSIAVLVLVTQP